MHVTILGTCFAGLVMGTCLADVGSAVGCVHIDAGQCSVVPSNRGVA